MNNTINTSFNNTSFNGRFLVIPEVYEKRIMFPRKIKKAIYKNEAIRDFISAGNPSSPRTFWEKFKDLFKRDEVLEVSYDTNYSALSDSVIFKFGKKGRKKVRTYKMSVDENIIKNLPDYNKNKSVKQYESRHDIIVDLFAKEVEKIKDFASLLSKDTITLSKPL